MIDWHGIIGKCNQSVDVHCQILSLSSCFLSVCFYFDLERLWRKWFLPGKKTNDGNSCTGPPTIDIDNLGWDCFVEGRIPYLLIVSIKPMFLRCIPRGSVNLIGLTHKQLLYRNSKVHHVDDDRTALQHGELVAKIRQLMKTKHTTLLARHWHYMKIDFAELGREPTIACQVWVANMEMAIIVTKVAKDNFCTQESLHLLCTPIALPVIQKYSPKPAAHGSFTDDSPPVNRHSPFLTPVSSSCNAQTLYSKYHTHHHHLTHTNYGLLSPTSPRCKRTLMSKTPHQFFPLFCPAVVPWPYDKIPAHLTCLHVCKKTVIPPDLDWSDSIRFGCIRNSNSCIHFTLVRLLCPTTEKKDKILSN